METLSDYCRHIRTRAYRGFEFKPIRNITITLLAGFAVAYLKVGIVNLATLLWTWLFAAVMFIVWELLAYGWRRFYLAPFAEYQDQASRIFSLEGQLASAHAQSLTSARRKEIVDALSRKLKEAARLWKHRPQTDAEIEPWVALIEGWKDGTLEIMRRGGCSPVDIVAIQTLADGNLAQFNPNKHRFSGNGRIHRGLITLDGYRQKLEAIIRRYDEGAP